MLFFGTSPNLWINQANVTLAGGVVKWFCNALDSSGNVYAGGIHRAICDYGNGPIDMRSAAFLVLAKYNPNGVLQWVNVFGGNFAGQLNGIAIDSSGMYVCGYAGGTSPVDFGGTLHPGAGPFKQMGGGFAVSNAFVGKVDQATGQFVWVTALGGTRGDNLFSITLDPSHNVYAIGNSASTVSTSPDTTVFSATTVGVCLVKLTSAGAIVWTQAYGSPAGVNSGSIGYGICIDPAGTVWASGQLSNYFTNQNLGGGVEPGRCIFLAKYSGTDGSWIWDRIIGGDSIGGQYSGTGWAVAYTPYTNQIILVGGFVNRNDGTLNFGAGKVPALWGTSNPTPGGVYWSAFDLSGNCAWVYSPNQNQGGTVPFGVFDFGSGVCFMPNGDLVFSGAQGHTAVYDIATGTVEYHYAQTSVFVARYDKNFTQLIWHDVSQDTQTGVGIAVNTDGANIIMAGFFQGDFGPSETIDGVSLSAPLNTSFAPTLYKWSAGVVPPPTIPNPADFIPIIYPGSSTGYTHAVTPSDDGFGVLLMDTSGECLVCNGIVDGTPVTFYGSPTNASLPSNITAGTTYYVSRVGAGPGTFYLSTTWPTLNLVAFVDAGSPTSFVRKNNNDWLSPSVNAVQKIGFKYTGPQPAGTVSMYWQYLFDDTGGTNWTTQESAAWYPWSQPNGVSLLKHDTTGVENINGYKWRAAFSTAAATPGMPVPPDAAFCAWQIAKISTTIVLGGSVTVPSAPLIVPRVATVQTIRGPIQTTSF